MRQISSNDDQWYKQGGFMYELAPWAETEKVAESCHFCRMIRDAIVRIKQRRRFLLTGSFMSQWACDL